MPINPQFTWRAIKYLTEQKIGYKNPSQVPSHWDNLRGKRQQQNSPKILPIRVNFPKEQAALFASILIHYIQMKQTPNLVIKLLHHLMASQSNVTNSLLPFLNFNAFFWVALFLFILREFQLITFIFYNNFFIIILKYQLVFSVGMIVF